MKNIVVVDDEQQICDLISDALSGNYQITTFDRVDNVIDHCKSEDVDLVITDLFMPEKSGLELIESVIEINKDIKILAISGGNRLKNCDFLPVAEILGASILNKPFTLSELRDKVYSLIQ